MARLNVPLETPLRRSTRNIKPALPKDDTMSIDTEPESSPIKGKANKSILPPPTPISGARITTPAPSARATPAPGARMTRAQLCGLSVVPEVDMPSITEPSEDADMDEDDAPKTVSKPKAAPKKAGNGRKTRAQVRAGSELMVVSVQVEDADMDGDEAPKVVVKPKIAAKKPQTIRKTRGQTVLSQIAEAGTQEEEFYDAEEEPVKVKTEEVESEVEEEQIQEPVQPVKKATRGHPAKKVPDDNMVVEEAAKAPEAPVKPKRGRKLPKKAHLAQIKQEEIEDSGGDNDTLDQKLASLSLGQMTIGTVDESVKPKPKPRGRPRKNTHTKKNGGGSLDVSGLDLALTYFTGIHDLAVGGGDDEDMQKILEMAEQGMETIQAALDGVKQE